MTIKIMGGEAALEAPLTVKEKEKEPAISGQTEQAEKPVVFFPETDANIPTVRRSVGRARKSGFFGIVFAQLVITAITGTGLWAACAFGIGQAGEICERLVMLFR